MSEKIWDWIIKVVSGSKRGVFWGVVITSLIIGAISFPYIDANLFYYNRIEKRINNLQNMVALTGTPLEENAALHEEYVSILMEMETARKKAISNATSEEDSDRERFVKFIAGAGLCYLVAVVVLFSKNKAERWSLRVAINNFSAAVLCVGLGSVVGWIFALVPTLGTVEVNAILAPIVEIAILWLVIEQPKKKTPVNT